MTGANPDQQKNSVLVSMKGYLGDTVIASPLLEGLREQGVPLHIAAPPSVRQVLGPRWESAFIDLGKKRGLQGLKAQVQAYRSLKPTTAILVNRSFRSALAAWIARVPNRVGHSTEGRAVLLTRSLPYDLQKSEIQCYLELAELCGLPIPNPTPPTCFLTEVEIACGLAKLNESSTAAPTAGQTIYALQPGARHPDKQLPISITVRLIETLRNNGFEPILVGGSEESEIANEVSKKLATPCPSLVGKLPLRETMGLLANVRFSIGADTGLMHLSVAVGTPTVVVFGPNPATKWGHFDPPHTVIDVPNGDMNNTSLDELVKSALNAAASDRIPTSIVSKLGSESLLPVQPDPAAAILR